MANPAAKSTARTVRFTKVVERSGTPQAHTLWLSPDKDVELKRAIASHRVMTVEPGTSGGKSDVGKIGFDAANAAGAQILFFPKSLKAFEGARVVGIKFDLVAQPKLEVGRAPEPKPARKKKPAHTAPIPRNQRQPKPETAAAPESPPKPPRQEPKSERLSPDEPAAAAADLRRAVRAALKELEEGNAVAAYRRLQRAIE